MVKRIWTCMAYTFFGAFKTDNQKMIFSIVAVAGGVLWFFMDAVYVLDLFGLDEVKYFATNGVEYSRGEQVEQLSGILESIATWWTLGRWSYEIKSQDYPVLAKLARVSTKYFAVLKVDMMIVTAAFSFYINPFVFNYPKTAYYFIEFGVFLLNVILFFVVPQLIRNMFLVRKK